jgi:hypothetical protein
MKPTSEGEERLLALLNSAPVVDGRIVDRLADPSTAQGIVSAVGGTGGAGEIPALVAVRDRLHAVIRQQEPSSVLAPFLAPVTQRPRMTAAGIAWTLDGPSDSLAAARAVVEWSRLATEMPGRLRPCENPHCNKFLIDHSKPNTARWCSMATCGNRMKASRYRASRATRRPA